MELSIKFLEGWGWELKNPKSKCFVSNWWELEVPSASICSRDPYLSSPALEPPPIDHHHH